MSRNGEETGEEDSLKTPLVGRFSPSPAHFVILLVFLKQVRRRGAGVHQPSPIAESFEGERGRRGGAATADEVGRDERADA